MSKLKTAIAKKRGEIDAEPPVMNWFATHQFIRKLAKQTLPHEGDAVFLEVDKEHKKYAKYQGLLGIIVDRFPVGLDGHETQIVLTIDGDLVRTVEYGPVFAQTALGLPKAPRDKLVWMVEEWFRRDPKCENRISETVRGVAKNPLKILPLYERGKP